MQINGLMSKNLLFAALIKLFHPMSLRIYSLSKPASVADGFG